MSQSSRTLSRLVGNPDNPRRITDAKLSQLGKSLARFGDLSGVVYNTTSKQLVGGHQRAKALPQDAAIAITKTYNRPTPTGTVAEGYVSIKDERFAYREVQWDGVTEKAANLSANATFGTFDLPMVADWMKELEGIGFDMALTGFDETERGALISADDFTPSDEEPARLDQTAKKTCPECGHQF